uniref:Ig-like domain-containing protein n=1 Tax=Poecilia formosa TaxID=48698 RepID=A0A096M691_POEFO
SVSLPSFAARLVVDFSSSQLFEGTRVTLKCEADDGSEGWTVKRNTTKRQSTCGDGWGKRTNSSCTIEFLFVQDSGLYWCESMSGSSSSSSSIQLSVSGKSYHRHQPIINGLATESCNVFVEAQTEPVNIRTSLNQQLLWLGSGRTSSSLHVAIPNNSHSFISVNINLKCVLSTAKPAATPPSSGAAPSASGPLQLAYTVLRHLVVFCPYFISTIIMVSLYQPRPFAETNLESSPPTESEPGIEVKVEVTAKNCV